MPKLFTISAKTRKLAADAIDDLIDQLGKEVTLTYPSVTIDCPNCVFDPTTQRSAGIYKPGGPRPFNRGTICPVCRGTGRLANQVTGKVKLLCHWDVKNFNFPLDTIATPYSLVQTKGYMSDLPKILQSRRIVLQPPETNLSYTFELWGEPIDAGNIVPGRYFTAIWRRVGG